MRIRKRMLPDGWYPGDEESIKRFIDGIRITETVPVVCDAIAGIVPHAGWSFSGDIAARVLYRLDPDFDTGIIIGGHLHSTAGVLFADEDALETPAGVIPIDHELREKIITAIDCIPDISADNSVEVILPMFTILFPEKRGIVFRTPPSGAAVVLAKAIAACSASLGRSVRVIGSTDLTHYGPSYGFTPFGVGRRAESWVKTVNDQEIIRHMLNMNPAEIITHSRNCRSSCSGGAAAAAAEFSRLSGVSEGRLVGYSTSLEKHESDSFVGYAGIIY